MHYIWEKRDVYLNVAKAPSFLAPGDTEHSRLCIAMATCSDEREISLLCTGSWQLPASTGAGEAACTSAKAEVDNGDIILNSKKANSLCSGSMRSWKTAAQRLHCGLTLGSATYLTPPSKARPAAAWSSPGTPEPFLPLPPQRRGSCNSLHATRDRGLLSWDTEGTFHSKTHRAAQSWKEGAAAPIHARVLSSVS